MTGAHADRIEMQNRLFGELSRMFGQEVPLYDKSLAVNARCNRAVCDLLALMHEGFAVSDAQLEKTSSERHGAIRIGREDEYRWIARFFACFAMEPHNFYDMTSVGAKSQPVIATAFRSLVHPEHRVFSSLLRTDYFDEATRERIESALAGRAVFSDGAKALIEKCEAEGGLSEADHLALVREGVGRIFKWTGEARDYGLYRDLCDAGFKIAADIACFNAHHLNHLTPNTFCMDLYTAAMKWRMGLIDKGVFSKAATLALDGVRSMGDTHFLRLHFKHLTRADVSRYTRRSVDDAAIGGLVESLASALAVPELDLAEIGHNGFKDATEGPDTATPVLLRQDAYRALTEPVRFTDPDGAVFDSEHTARFGEIEQRFYATTPEGRALYDECLGQRVFDRFPKTLGGLLEAGLVHARYEATEAGRAKAGSISSVDLLELAREGLVTFEGLRYEDFLPVSAAGIFASNLNQYGTDATASDRPVYTREMMESILGRPIVDAGAVYAGLEAESALRTYADLGLLEKLPADEKRRLESAASVLPSGAASGYDERAVAAARA